MGDAGLLLETFFTYSTIENFTLNLLLLKEWLHPVAEFGSSEAEEVISDEWLETMNSIFADRILEYDKEDIHFYM
jgi:hypothetical protein